MNILIVEDNEPEQLIIKEAFQEAGVNHDLYMVKDGVEAMDYLNENGVYQQAVSPDLIILDLNMPRKNGLEVISDIRSNSRWAHIPILIFSNSEYTRDISRCYALGANAYLNKPVDYRGFLNLAHTIDKFWFKLVRY